jgi:hypothetical protein
LFQDKALLKATNLQLQEQRISLLEEVSSLKSNYSAALAHGDSVTASLAALEVRSFVQQMSASVL